MGEERDGRGKREEGRGKREEERYPEGHKENNSKQDSSRMKIIPRIIQPLPYQSAHHNDRKALGTLPKGLSKERDILEGLILAEGGEEVGGGDEEVVEGRDREGKGLVGKEGQHCS